MAVQAGSQSAFYPLLYKDSAWPLITAENACGVSERMNGSSQVTMTAIMIIRVNIY